LLYTIQHIAGILHAASSISKQDAIVEHLSIDSRRISFPSTTLFFSLQTERRDAHVFIDEIYKRGVMNFIVKKGYDANKFPGANFIFVDDTLRALQDLAAHHRSQFSYPVIGITGSNGKTVTKEWLYQLLHHDHNIVRSPRSYNSQVGVPLSVWQMSEEHDLAIFEAGISKPGEMDALEKIIRPSIGIFTNIGEAHASNFKNALHKASEKCKLFKHADVIIYPSDDPLLSEAISTYRTHQKLFSWGRSAMADVQITAIQTFEEETKISFLFDGTDQSYTIPFIDNAAIYNSITSVCVLLYLHEEEAVIASRMQDLQPVDMRLQLIHAINNCTLINDSYSFDISSFSLGLDFLMQQQQQLQKAVIISDIPSSPNNELYKQVAGMLFTRNIHRIITIGEQWGTHHTILKDKIPVTEHYHNTEAFIKQFTINQFHSEAILLKGARVFEFEKIVSLLEKKVHQTVMEINLTALAHNLNQYRSILKKDVKLMAMVKAFAYGSGSREVANLLQFHNVDYLAVAYADEGMELRNAGISLPIMVLNVDEAAFEAIVQHSLEPELFSFNIFRAFDAFLHRQGLQKYPVHVKLDTGMHRLGFEEKDLPELLPLLKQNNRVAIQSVFSHLVASEDPAEDAFTFQQAKILERCCAQIQESIGYSFLMHISNSAAIARSPALQYDMVRLGIGLYGVDSSNQQELSLQPVATLKTTIAQLKKLKTGDSVGYNRLGKLMRDSLIATIRIGYADGFDRKLGNGTGNVFINGQVALVIGAVSMDMAMVDVTDIPSAAEGDEVEIFGDHISVQQLAKWCGTIPYEILAGISQRVKRVYVEE
jgi:alanine racemase